MEIPNISSVKWGHLTHFEPNSIKTISSIKILWGHLEHLKPNSISSIKVLWGHLAHFELGPITTITKNQNKNLVPLK